MPLVTLQQRAGWVVCFELSGCQAGAREVVVGVQVQREPVMAQARQFLGGGG